MKIVGKLAGASMLTAVLITPLAIFLRSQLGASSTHPVNYIPDLFLLSAAVLCLKQIWQDLKARRPLIVLAIVYVAFSLLISAITSDSYPAFLAGALINFRLIEAWLVGWAVGVKRLVSMDQLTKIIMIPYFIIVAFGIAQMTFLPHDILRHAGYSLANINPAPTIDDNPDLVRVISTARGPNALGAYLIIPLLMIAAKYWNKRSWPAAGAFLAGIIVMYGTGSRSSWVGFAVAILSLSIIKSWPAMRRRALPIGLLVVSMFIVSFSVRDSDWYARNIQHNDPQTGAVTTSNSEHFRASGEAFKRTLAQPAGCGLGCAGPASRRSSSPEITENYYLQISREVGVIGLALMLAWFSLVGLKLFSLKKEYPALLPIFIGLSVVGLFLHVWADPEATIIFWFAAGFVATKNAIVNTNDGSSNKKRSTNKKTARAA